MAKFFIIVAGLGGLLSVALGAFGAHGLKDKLDSYAMGIYQTAVQYQMYHSLALLALGIILLHTSKNILLYISGYSFLMGMIVFSGSLYILSLTGIKWLGAITPLGGLAFLIGWFCLVLFAVFSKKLFMGK